MHGGVARGVQGHHSIFSPTTSTTTATTNNQSSWGQFDIDGGVVAHGIGSAEDAEAREDRTRIQNLRSRQATTTTGGF
ncbi:hypothetical protein CTA1_4389 [Colletotrichum tanaceti]|uniref:Uncharacterized protein n=1 Tax=Colletotrichum tanaceti TaxID=1306861 RepID=A0A4U6X8B2_9PEZI|nr:hypothetical protein CTA1_4389 [Colletotrichum tanaceti]